MTVTTSDPIRVTEEAAGAPAVSTSSPETGTARPTEGEDLVEEDLLVEDVSIDGMCGVY
jgi:mycofactocin precursor